MTKRQIIATILMIPASAIILTGAFIAMLKILALVDLVILVSLLAGLLFVLGVHLHAKDH